ncbi:DNA-directed DNA polymerase [Handroanthus impetiginosus]|uniref:DNA-directed DNA polymerase n=1 Tax=Handroanthus impetiginosus TaxID=429701 RepID=A0A2G9GJ07_9LAMI|nr:DNA-directed DNA polymerase [Handroanthus impetiginosus]
MDKIFKNLKNFCLVYINDILIFSKILEEHKKHLEIVYYLEILLSSTGIILQSHITIKIKEFPKKLETLKELQSLLELLNYGRQFVKNLSKWKNYF